MQILVDFFFFKRGIVYGKKKMVRVRKIYLPIMYSVILYEWLLKKCSRREDNSKRRGASLVAGLP